MNTRFTPLKRAALLLLLSIHSLQLSAGFAQGTAFTYQGRLNEGTAPAVGIYDLRFAVYDAASAGAQQGGTVTNTSTAISNGLFTITLDFGNQFPGANRWLEIAVRTNGAGAFVTLSPRQPLAPAPYAIFAGAASNVLGVLPGGGLSGSYSSAVTFNNAANSFNGSYVGNGGGLTNLNAATLGDLASSNFWITGGNSVSAGQFLGSTNNQVVELRVNNRRALRLEPTTDAANRSNLVNVVNGASVNYVDPGAYGATIGGGGAGNYDGVGLTNIITANLGTIGGGGGNTILLNSDGSTISGGSRNQVLGAYNGVIAGGVDNGIQINSSSGVIGGGQNNTILSNSYAATISGGYGNGIGTNVYYATIGGGYSNQIALNGIKSIVGGGMNNYVGGGNSMIGGGEGNAIQTLADHSVISGGWANTIAGSVAFSVSSVIGGGYANLILTNHQYGVIGGGYGNTILANGQYATVPGGFANTAGGADSFAAGNQAHATNDGSFVWADSQNAGFYSTRNDQFSVRAAGGVVLVTGSAGVKLGSGGQYFAPGGLENLRILRGVVDAAGNNLHGAGFTVARTGTGAYTVTFSSGFADFPAVTVSAQSGLARMATTTNVGLGSTQIRTFDATGSAVDAQFHFTAIGLQ